MTLIVLDWREDPDTLRCAYTRRARFLNDTLEDAA